MKSLAEASLSIVVIIAAICTVCILITATAYVVGLGIQSIANM